MINYEGMAFPKKSRIKDPKAMKNKRGKCEFCRKGGTNRYAPYKNSGKWWR